MHAGRPVVARSLLCAVLAVQLGACASEDGARPGARPSGPPEVQVDAVDEHAAQFAELGPRRAGSQEELAAATYITAHLQRAGYVVLLDAVPVKDLVRSTNVVARPPSGYPPAVVVAAPYDTGPRFPARSESLGVFLELARALRVLVPEHSVEFVALGAESAGVAGGRLGSRRLAAELVDEDSDPVVVVIEGSGERGEFTAAGSVGPEILSAARAVDEPTPPPPSDASEDPLWEGSGLDYALVAGPPDVLGPVLLRYLARHTR